MAEEKKIATGYIGNALRSAADNHTTTFADEIFDTERQKYQNEVTADLEATDNEIKGVLESEIARAKAAEEANAQAIAEEKAAIIGTDRIAEGAVTYDKLQNEIKEVVEDITYTENPEFIYVKTDADGSLLGWIEKDGTVGWSKGVPTPIQEELKKLEQLIKDNTEGDESVVSRVTANEASIVAINEALDRKVDEVYEENPEYAKVVVDDSNKIINAVTKDGKNYLPYADIDTLLLQEEKVDDEAIKSQYYIDNPEFAKVVVDKEDRIIYAVRHDGIIILSEIENYADKDFVINYVDANIAKYGVSLSEREKLNTIKILPDYWETYLAEKIKSINSNSFNYQLPFDSFLFITDIHCYTNAGNSKLILSELIKKTVCKTVVFGGDIPGGKVPDNGTDAEARELLIREMASYEEYQNSVHPYGQWLPCRGNHDLSAIEIVYLGQNEQGMPMYKVTFRDGLKKGSLRDLFINHLKLYPNIHIGQDDESVYYYYDNNEAKIRYIITDGNKTLDNGNVAYGINDTQLRWIIEEAIMTASEGYGFVFVIHQAISPRLSTGASVWTKLRNLCKAIKNKTNIQVGEQVYDFSNLKNNVIMVLSGHQHCDGEIYDEGILNVVTACDALNNDGKFSMYTNINNIGSRSRNNISEQVLDYITIKPQDRIVLFNRIGWGRNRLFHAETIEINTGDTYEIPFINDNITTIKATDTNIIDYMSIADTDTISINNNTITALKAGDIMLVGFDSDYNGEFFNIKIK